MGLSPSLRGSLSVPLQGRGAQAGVPGALPAARRAHPLYPVVQRTLDEPTPVISLTASRLGFLEADGVGSGPPALVGQKGAGDRRGRGRGRSRKGVMPHSSPALGN